MLSAIAPLNERPVCARLPSSSHIVMEEPFAKGPFCENPLNLSLVIVIPATHTLELDEESSSELLLSAEDDK
ncbi:hypothetical protein R83H12_02616 [Fibrobacteria bacterium R8-3-H12]